MTDKKLNDEEIITSLEVIASTRNCNECKIRNCKWGTCNCAQITANAAINLINRQKSEIERLKTENKIYIEANQIIAYQRDQRDKEIDELQKQIYGIDVRENKIKAEAYKEFAENAVIRLTDNYHSEYAHWIDDTIDNLLKEMVGEEE